MSSESTIARTATATVAIPTNKKNQKNQKKNIEKKKKLIHNKKKERRNEHDVDMTFIVLSMDRCASLRRLLASLFRAKYILLVLRQHGTGCHVM